MQGQFPEESKQSPCRVAILSTNKAAVTKMLKIAPPQIRSGQLALHQRAFPASWLTFLVSDPKIALVHTAQVSAK